MKGITPVIAIILLLLITISMVGFTFLWFSRIQQELTGSVSSQTEREAKAAGTSVRVDQIDRVSGNVYIRNTGTQILNMSEVTFYNNSVTPVNCPQGWTSGGPVAVTLAPGAVANCSAFSQCASIRLTTIGTGDSRSC